MKKKGCDASNIYDEEVPEKDQEYSDDEKERGAKKARKMLNKRKHEGREADVVDEEYEEEEGEIKSDNKGS